MSVGFSDLNSRYLHKQFLNMVVTSLIVFLVLDAAWILYAMKTAPVIEDEDEHVLSEQGNS